MENNIGADCQLAYQLNYHPIFRISVFWTFLVSFCAIPGLCYFIIGRLLSLRFHGNLKCLLLVYFCNILLSAILSCFGFGYRFFVPFFAKTECDLLIDPTFFKYWHVTSLLVLTSSTLLPIGFSIERFVALKLVARYEHFRTILGPALVVILIGSDLICVKLIYLYETFSGPHLSLILVPSTSAMQFNIFFYFLLSVQLFNLVCNFFILKLHSRLKTRYLQRTETLSLRYEMEEIEQSSRFTLVVSFTHMLFVGCYIVCGIITRTVGSSFFENSVNYTAIRAIFCSFPTYSLVIVFIGLYTLHRLHLKRKNTVHVTIQLKSTGSEGMQNYQDVICKHWDLPSQI